MCFLSLLSHSFPLDLGHLGCQWSYELALPPLRFPPLSLVFLRPLSDIVRTVQANYLVRGRGYLVDVTLRCLDGLRCAETDCILRVVRASGAVMLPKVVLI